MKQNKKIREFPVDLNREMVYQAIGMNNEEAKNLSSKIGNYLEQILSKKVENIAEIAQEIGETFTIQELVLNSIILIMDQINREMKQIIVDEKEKEDDDDELDIRSVL